MTFIAGYIYQGAVHIVADSAETIGGKNISEVFQQEEHQSTMLESAVINGEQVIVENANKIYNIHDRFLLAFAGSVYEGIETIRVLLETLAAPGDMRLRIPEFFKTFEPLHTQFIIGFIEDQQPYMYCYHNSRQKLLISQNLAICSIGTNKWIPPEAYGSMINKAFQNSHSQDDLLITAISTVQMTTQGLRTLESGVGGHINGAYITPTGIHWAKDTTYILYSSLHLDKPQTIHVIHKYNRDNAVFVRSDLIQRIFITEFAGISWQELNDKWGTELQYLANAAVADYYILLSYETGILFLINNKNNNSCKVFTEDGQFKFSTDLVESNTLHHTNRADYDARFVVLSNFPLKKKEEV